PERAPGDLLADPAEAEDGERLPFELDPAVRRSLPATLLEGRVRLRDVPGERDEQADRVLRGGDDVRLRRVRDDDAAPRRRLHVPRRGAAVLDRDAEVAEGHLRGGKRRRDVEDVVVADVADAEDLALEVALAVRDRDPEAVAEGSHKVGTVEALRHPHRSDDRRRVVVRREELEAHRLAALAPS